MKKNNQNFLKEVFYKYWMNRVPELDENEAIDHLEWELRNMNIIPPLVNGKISRKNKNKLELFLKEKKI